MERAFGPEVGRFIQALHEEHGVRFHLGVTAKAIHADRVELSDGTSLPAELVVMGVGVKPRTALAKQAGLTVENGIVTDERLQTSAPGVYAIGDVAQYRDSRTKEFVRVEHWAVAQRQGQAVARILLGTDKPFEDVPFFWSQHYDVSLSYVGHAARWDRVDISGSLEKRDVTVTYSLRGKPLAVLTLGRDRVSLEAEAAMEQGDLQRLAEALA